MRETERKKVFFFGWVGGGVVWLFGLRLNEQRFGRLIEICCMISVGKKRRGRERERDRGRKTLPNEGLKFRAGK